MATGRPSVAAAGALVCAAVSIWVTFGALTFLDGASDGRYVGVLPSLVWLGLLVGGALLAAWLVRPDARVVAPLWLTAVVLLPWLPLPVPLAVFVWTGHVTTWVWAATIAAMLAPRVRGTRIVAAVLRLDARPAALLAGMLALAVYGTAAVRTAPHHPSGDEPHYLVMTQSLLKDGDLQIENNHRARDFAAFYNGDLPPDYIRRGQNGAIYSSHAPGVSVLMLPAFALFGYRGTVVVMVMLSALTTALTWWLARRISGSAAAAWFAWASLLSAPTLLLANAVFPDSVAPLLVAIGLVPLVDARARSPKGLVAVGAAVSLLPWLHTRLAVVAGMLGVAIVARVAGDADRADRWRRSAAFLVLPALCAAAWFGFFWSVYGTFDPTAPIGKRLLAPLLSQGVAGLLFDRKFGLLVAAPVFLCSAAGGASLLVSGPRRLGIELLAIVVPYVAMIAAWDMWWGGTSPPARFLVPVLPLFAVAAAVFVSRARSTAARTTAAGLMALSLLVSVTMAWVDRGALVFADRPDVSPLYAWLTPVVDVTLALPDAFADSPLSMVLQVGGWLAALAAAGFAAAAARRRGGTPVPPAVAFGLAGQIALTAVVAATWPADVAMVKTPSRAGAAVIRRLSTDAARIGVVYRPLTTMDARDVAEMIPLAHLDVARREESVLGTPPLPPGIYELTGAMRGVEHAGAVGIRTDGQSPPIARLDTAALPATWTERIVVPVAVPGLRLELDDAAGASLRALTLRFVSPLARSALAFTDLEAGHGARYGKAVFYYMRGRAWLEEPGVWVGGGVGAEFAVAPDDERRLRLLLRNGAAANQVAVASGQWRAEFDLAAGEARTIEIPTSRTLAATPVRVEPSTGFRPSEIDPASQDDRLLGVWIQPAE